MRFDMIQSTDAEIVSAIQKHRSIHGLSIRQFAEQIGISFSALARIERGGGSPNRLSRIKIFHSLGWIDNDEYFEVMGEYNDARINIKTVLESFESIDAKLDTLESRLYSIESNLYARINDLESMIQMILSNMEFMSISIDEEGKKVVVIEYVEDNEWDMIKNP